MASPTTQLHDDCETTVRMRRAAEARDTAGVMEAMADGVTLRSPITDQVVFRGRQEVSEILGFVFDVLEDIDYFADIGDQQTRALFYTARVGTEPVEEAMRIGLDDAGLIRELTIFYRPLPGLASFAAALAPRVANRRHGRFRAVLARLLITPLALFTRLGERIIPWFT